jgi:hypothetical protein
MQIPPELLAEIQAAVRAAAPHVKRRCPLRVNCCKEASHVGRCKIVHVPGILIPTPTARASTSRQSQSGSGGGSISSSSGIGIGIGRSKPSKKIEPGLILESGRARMRVPSKKQLEQNEFIELKQMEKQLVRMEIYKNDSNIRDERHDIKALLFLF